jgi:hypothetical protein
MVNLSASPSLQRAIISFHLDDYKYLSNQMQDKGWVFLDGNVDVCLVALEGGDRGLIGFRRL